ncbi:MULTISPECIES: cation:proton antiporter [Mesotoga]|uniref:cation:proton antiporter n=1 Tax=Mesotoga TaxID=1184396 RepID=UPI000EF213A9|nr:MULTISPECIES: cation:proton antiporter [Mesotoga]MCB1224158.1 cation:proton antiporter [Mesotoga sp.]RLL84207.1 cation:proton antiporter [Mesotoga sp. BH458_6_3_2_1]HQC13954.1 cation:proton antiporter [Mesotoga prima]
MIGFSIFFSLILMGAGLTLYRLLRGPTVPDRVAALDILNVMITSAIVLFSLIDGNPLFLDIALVYAALSFLETIVVARYLEGRR